jgi:hypothetical protein
VRGEKCLGPFPVSRACVEDVDHDLINHQLRATRDLQLKCEFIRLFEAYTRGYQNVESSIMILFVFSELPWETGGLKTMCSNGNYL